MRYRPDIDGLRALAVIPVVLFHAGFSPLSGGFIGVDIFFVISGYLISSIIIDEMKETRFSLIGFYERRLRRLFPALITMLVACGFAAAVMMIPEDLTEFGYSAIATLLFYSNFFFFWEVDYFSSSANLKPLLHTWSLSIEEQFYIFFPLALFVTLRFMRLSLLPYMIALALLGSLFLSYHYTNVHQIRAFYMPYTRAWELLSGCLLASLRGKYLITDRVAALIGPLGFLTILLCFVTYTKDASFPGLLAVLPVAGAVALILAGSSVAAPTTKILSKSPAVFIGKISYPLYLWHWPVFVFLDYGELGPLSTPLAIAGTVLSIILAWGTVSIIERPVRQGRVWRSKRSVFMASATSGLAVVAIAGGAVLTSGFPSRMSTQQLSLLDEDRFATERPDCHQTFQAKDVCIRGATQQNPSFILIGDSHAHALSPGLFAAAQASEISGWQFTADGFLPLPERFSADNQGRENAALTALREVLTTRIDAKTIVVAGAWHDYIQGENWKGQSWIYTDAQTLTPRKEDNPQVFERGLRRFLEEFDDRNIILLDDVPAGEELDLSSYVRRMRGAFYHGSPIGHQDLSIAQERRTSYEPLLYTISESYEHVTYLPVFETFCGSTGCSLFAENGEPVFRDGDHLSNYGALQWAPQLKDWLLPLLTILQ